MTILNDTVNTLDPSVDTMAIMMACDVLEQADGPLRVMGKDDLADALEKLQIDAGLQHEAIATEVYAEMDYDCLSDDVLMNLKIFEPVTHERLKLLDVVADLLLEGDLKDQIKDLACELAHVVSFAPTGPANNTPPAP